MVPFFLLYAPRNGVMMQSDRGRSSSAGVHVSFSLTLSHVTTTPMFSDIILPCVRCGPENEIVPPKDCVSAHENSESFGGPWCFRKTRF